MRRLFVSDLHLSDPEHPHFAALTTLLRHSDADEIYLLGDLCEVWIGDDDDGPLATAFTALLADAARHARVFMMHGNRDFLYGPGLERATGCQLLGDPHVLPDGVLLSHGDAFCVDDHAYQQVRALLRSAEWQQEVLSRPLPERRELARQMREQSRVSNANKAENIMDVSGPEVARVMSEYGASVLVHGHTHRPGIHREAWGRRYVLGAWERCAWALRQDRGAFTLSCLPVVNS